MAYKNQKKNKKHNDLIRKANASKKHSRKYQRKHKNDKPLTEKDCEMYLRLQGLIK